MLMHELYQRERHADFVREAENDRKRNAENQSSRKPFYKPALSKIGATLVDVGTRLQDNIETGTATPMLSASERA